MATTETPKITAELLSRYSKAALLNADELLAEANLLYEHSHNARAYFLAVACIEELGKSLFAFDSQNRNFSDPAVCAKLKAGMESHSQKINCALGVWALSRPKQSETFTTSLNLISSLRRGREPSMYTDLRTEPDRVQTPREVVRDRAARDCVMLAQDICDYARRHVKEKTPAKITAAHDKLFTMKSAKVQSLINNADFWWYFIARMEAGKMDFAEAILGYERHHVETNTLFRSETD